MSIEIRTIAEGELLSTYEVPAYDEGEESWETFKELTSYARRLYAGRSNVVVQFIVDGLVDAENHVNPAPAY